MLYIKLRTLVTWPFEGLDIKDDARLANFQESFLRIEISLDSSISGLNSLWSGKANSFKGSYEGGSVRACIVRLLFEMYDLAEDSRVV